MSHAQTRIALLIALSMIVLSPGAHADDGIIAHETFGDWTVEEARAGDGSVLCRLGSDVEGVVGEVGLVATADGALFLAFRDDRVRMSGEWIGRTIGIGFPDGSRFTLPIARLVRSDETRRPANTILARLDAPGGAVLRHFYADDALSVLLPDGTVHDALLSGAADAAGAMTACVRRIRAAR